MAIPAPLCTGNFGGFAAVDVGMAGGTFQRGKFKLNGLAALNCTFPVAFRTGDCPMGPFQWKARFLVMNQRKFAGSKTPFGVANLAVSICQFGGKLTPVVVAVAIPALFKRQSPKFLRTPPFMTGAALQSLVLSL